MKSNTKNLKEEALQYHSEGRPGKIEVVPTKPYSSQHDLSLAYSPGVAAPCLEIEKNPEDAYKYTAKGNLVAVISNGTAVLGLGNIGAMAGKPVMEGKGLLFKTFADIDVFDIEVDTGDVDKFIETVRNISPTFGGINLEDIKAPECFEIEERLKQELDIPVMHDDQHGTAIISAAALLNALELVGKDIAGVRVVVNGAGAAAVSCAKLYLTVGIRRENMIMCDSKGVINTSRQDLNQSKKAFATDLDINTLEEALVGADVFLGLSVADVLTPDMVRSMADNPIVMALANPDPEISYESAMASRPDIIFATGRSDYPNQVNNVLGFPYIFRGALDVRATKINEEMKIAATRALAELAKEPVPDIVATAYGSTPIKFGRDYLIPKPLDPRLISSISVAVAKAAIESGVARHVITDWDAYRDSLEKRMGRDSKLLRRIRSMAVNAPKRRVLFSEGDTENTIKAAVSLASEELLIPVLVGERHEIDEIARENHLDLSQVEILDFRTEAEAARRERFARRALELMGRRGLSPAEALKNMKQRDWFTIMAMEEGEADAAVIGYSRRYTKALEPVKEVFGRNGQTLAAMHIVTTTQGPMFFADTAINDSPTAQQLADIAALTAEEVRRYGIEPVIALLSNSNFGTDTQAESLKVARAVEILHERYPDLIVDGEMKADIALRPDVREKSYPFTKIGTREVNTFIFPNLSAANISYKIMGRLGGAEVTGPVLLGLDANIHLQAETASVRSMRNLAVIAAVHTEWKKGK
ncbi:MAG: NADP-dependent malic enzyme [Rikenellaceae bacterium]|nr:NADP-dependent malic enzyme [Rikenellaceae bacterium]